MDEKILKEARQGFGLLFKDLRKKKCLTQQQVGDACGVSLQTINKVELGKFPYSVDLLIKLGVTLGFTIKFEFKEIGQSTESPIKFNDGNLAAIMRDFGDWLQANHPSITQHEKVFCEPNKKL